MHEHDQLTNLPVVIEHAGDHVVVERRDGRAGLRLGELRRRRLPLREHHVHLHAGRARQEIQIRYARTTDGR